MNASSFETSYVAIQRGGTANLATSIAAQQLQNVTEGYMITSEEQLRREKRRQKKWTVLIATVGLVGFFVALAAMIVEASTVAYLAFLFPLITGPYAIHQRRKLNKLPTLVFVMNQIRDQINRISIQNSVLHSENTRLEKEVLRLNDAEAKLQAVVDKSGHNVETICSLVKENAETQRQMKVCMIFFGCTMSLLELYLTFLCLQKLLNAQELQSLLTAVLQSDANADHVMSPQELEKLLLRLKSFSVVDEVKLRDAFKHMAEQNASTTALYNHLASSQTEDEGDFSLGYGDWLFEEA